MRMQVASLALSAMLLALNLSVEAQQPRKLYRISYLGSRSASSNSDTSREVFREELRKLGYVEGQTIAIEYRSAEGNPERVPDLAADLVRLKVDVIVTPAAIAVRAAKQATRTIPIVMAGARVDAVAAGFATSLARPGGNITGLTGMDSELHGKRLELLKEVSGRISHVALLSGRLSEQDRKDIEAAGRALDIQIRFFLVPSLHDLENAFSAMSKNLPKALIVAASPATLDQPARITDFATKKRLLTVYERSESVEAGGLMSYGAETEDLYRRAAMYVDKILKGANPGELPIERPTKFELVINQKTAKQIGLTVPPNVLARADRVIK